MNDQPTPPDPAPQVEKKTSNPLRAIWSLLTGAVGVVLDIIEYFIPDDPPETSRSGPAPRERPVTVSRRGAEKIVTQFRWGTRRWEAPHPPQRLRELHLKEAGGPKTIKARGVDTEGNETTTITVYGAAEEGALKDLTEVLELLSRRLGHSLRALREIHLLPQLGRGISAEGYAGPPVVAFTLDDRGVMILSTRLLIKRSVLEARIEQILSEDRAYQRLIKKAHSARWDLLEQAQQRVKALSGFRPADHRMRYGSLYDHPILGPEQPLPGSIFVNQPAREAIVVPEHDFLLTAVVDELALRLRRLGEAPSADLEFAALGELTRFVGEKLPRTTEAALRDLLREQRVANDEPIGLPAFIAAEVGVAEHHALLAGLLAVRIQTALPGVFEGIPAIDRNSLPGATHAWLRYTSTHHGVLIVDPLKSFCGRVDDYFTDRWPYERGEDLLRPRQPKPIFEGP